MLTQLSMPLDVPPPRATSSLRRGSAEFGAVVAGFREEGTVVPARECSALSVPCIARLPAIFLISSQPGVCSRTIFSANCLTSGDCALDWPSLAISISLWQQPEMKAAICWSEDCEACGEVAAEAVSRVPGADRLRSGSAVPVRLVAEGCAVEGAVPVRFAGGALGSPGFVIF